MQLVVYNLPFQSLNRGPEPTLFAPISPCQWGGSFAMRETQSRLNSVVSSEMHAPEDPVIGASCDGLWYVEAEARIKIDIYARGTPSKPADDLFNYLVIKLFLGLDITSGRESNSILWLTRTSPHISRVLEPCQAWVSAAAIIFSKLLNPRIVFFFLPAACATPVPAG